MKQFQLKREIWLWVLVLIPVAYLAYVWSAMPEIIPTHFGMDGKPDDYSHKIMYVYMIPALGLGNYLLMTFIPYFDPKKKLEIMGNKYFMIKFFTVLLICVVCIFIVRSAITGSIGDVSTLFCILGAFFLLLGNYLQRVKHNYFIGFKTPWSLENEEVWKKTHVLGGRLYFLTGLLTIVLSLILKEKVGPVFLGMIMVASIIPCVYSYIVYRKLAHKE